MVLVAHCGALKICWDNYSSCARINKTNMYG